VILRDRLGHLDQALLVTERPAIDLRVAHGFSLRLNPERGLEGIGLHGTYTFLPARDAEGALPFLDAGEERTTRIAVTAKEVA
jgi:hypothetical protein